MLSICHGFKSPGNKDTTEELEKQYQQIQDNYGIIIANRAQLMIDMLPKQAPNQGQVGEQIKTWNQLKLWNHPLLLDLRILQLS